MYIKIEDYCAATGVSTATAGRRLSDVPFRIPTRGRGRKHFPLAAAVMTLKAKEADAVPELVQHARDLCRGDPYVEARALPIAESFVDWCEGGMRDRARAAMNGFVVAVSNSRICTPTIVRNLEPLKALFVLHPDVTRWILVGGNPPDVDNLAPSFAVANNAPALDEYHLNLEHAA
ncbi:hypothetical protein [Roseovarius sp. MBR-78]|uniref:hypothetical protein n=1 Tax=Roseovarius sp. MBR-78 TaxID=3156460 RepID=UPI0033941BF7